MDTAASVATAPNMGTTPTKHMNTRSCSDCLSLTTCYTGCSYCPSCCFSWHDQYQIRLMSIFSLLTTTDQTIEMCDMRPFISHFWIWLYSLYPVNPLFLRQLWLACHIVGNTLLYWGGIFWGLSLHNKVQKVCDIDSFTVSGISANIFLSIDVIESMYLCLVKRKLQHLQSLFNQKKWCYQHVIICGRFCALGLFIIIPVSSNQWEDLYPLNIKY